MSKLLRRRVYFRVPVDFYAESEKGMEHVVKSYSGDPCPQADGCNVDHGCYGWKVGKARREQLPQRIVANRRNHDEN